MAVNIVNATVQVVFYRADEPIVLGVAHIATGPVFAAIVAVTLICARRVITASDAPPHPDTQAWPAHLRGRLTRSPVVTAQAVAGDR